MHTIHAMNGHSESQISNAVFDACRGNESRNTARAGRYTVKFTVMASGEHKATVSDAVGLPAGHAVVDSMD